MSGKKVTEIESVDIGAIRARITADIGGFETGINKAKAKTAELGGAAKDVTGSFTNLNTKLGEIGASSAQIAKINDAIRKANPDILRKGLEEVRAELERLGVSSSEIDKITQELEKNANGARAASKEMLALGAAYAGLAAAMANVITKSVETAAAFEQSMAKVRAITQATAEDFERLRKQSIELGASTVFSASQAADAQSFLAMAGFEVNEIISAMPGVLNLAAAGQMEIARTADIASNILTGFGLSAEETTRVVDVMAKAMTSSNTNIEQLGNAMKYVAPVAASVGVDIETAAAAVGKLSDAGIQGEMAGTSLRAILLRLVNPVGEAADVMDFLGIKTADAAGNILPFTEILGNVQRAFSQLSQEQQVQAAGLIAGQEAVAGFMTLINAGQAGLESFANDLRNSGGAAEQLAETQMDTLNGAIVELKSALEGAGIAIGDNFAPAIRGVVEYITQLVQGFASMNPTLQSAIVAFTTSTAAVLGLVGAFTALKLALDALGVTMGRLALLAGPYLAVAVAIGAVTAGITALVSKSNEAAEAVRQHEEAQSKLNDTLNKSPLNNTVQDIQNMRNMLDELNPLLEERAKLQERLNEIQALGERGQGTPALLAEAMDINEELEKMDKQLRTMGYDGVEDATQKAEELNRQISESIPALREMERAEITAIAAKVQHIDRVEELRRQYDDLTSQEKLSEQQKAQLANVVDALTREYPGLIAQLDEENRWLITNRGSLDDLISAENQSVAASAQASKDRLQNWKVETEAKLKLARAQISMLEKIENFNFAESKVGQRLPGQLGKGIDVVGDYLLRGVRAQAQSNANQYLLMLNDIEKDIQAITAGSNFTTGGLNLNDMGKDGGKGKGKSGKSAAEVAADARKKAYDADVATIRYQADMYEWSADKQIEAYEKLRAKHKQFLAESIEDRRTLDLQIKRLTEDSIKARYDFSAEWIAKEERRMKEAGKSEEEIAQMKLKTWTRVRDRYEKDSEQYKQADEEVYKARTALARAQYEASSEWIAKEERRMEENANSELSIAQMKVNAWTRVRDRYLKDSDEYKKADEQLYRSRKELARAQETEIKRQYDASADWIKAEERRMDEAGKSEQEITKMKIDAWTRVRNRYTKDSEYYKRADEELYRLRKSYTDQTTKQVEDSVKAQKAAIESAKKADLDAIEARKKAFVEAQDARIKAIDDLIAKEAEFNSDADYETRLAEKLARVDELSSAVGPEGIKEREDTLKEIERMKLEHERELRKRGLEEQKRAIQDEKDTQSKAFDDEKAAVEAQYNTLIDAFNSYGGDIKAIESAIATFRVSESAAANAAILTELDSFVAQYNAKMAQLTTDIADDPRDRDLAEYNANKDAWSAAKARGDSAEMARLAARNEELRRLYGIAQDTGKLQSFSIGGIVKGARGEAVPVIAHAGEMVLNTQQQAALWAALSGNGAIVPTANGAPTTSIVNHIDMGVDEVVLTDKADIAMYYDERARVVERLQTQGVKTR